MNIIQLFQRLHKFFIRIPNWAFIALMVFSIHLLQTIFLLFTIILTSYSGGEIGGPAFLNQSISPYFIFMIGVVIVPIIETFIFQTSIIHFSKKIIFIKNRIWLQISISTIIFGLSHSYSLIYIFTGFLGGLVFAYSYIIYEQKTGNLFGMLLLYMD